MADAPRPPDGEEASECNLIVNYLPWMMSQEEVRRLFSRVGSVDSCRLVKDKRTGQSLGYAFVRFRSRSMANRAIQTFNGFRIQNKTIKVSIARPRCSRLRGANVYVSGLETTVTSVDLNELFRPFGTIISCRVLCDEQTGLSRGVGFVLFNLRSEAESAIRCLNSTLPNGAKRPMRLKFATRPTTGLRRPRLLPSLTTLTLPFMGSLCGPVMPYIGLAVASTELPAAIAQLTPFDDLEVICCNLATSNDEIVHRTLSNNERCRPIDPVIRQVAVVVRTRVQNGEATPDGDQQQPFLDSEQEKEEDDKAEAAVGGPGSLQSPIVVGNLPTDVDESGVWRLFGGTVQGHLATSAHCIPHIGHTTRVVQGATVNMSSSPREAALSTRSLEELMMEKMRRGGELEMLTEDKQQQQQRSCDGQLFDHSICLGKDYHVYQGQGSYLGQTKAICSQGRIVNKRHEQQMITDDLAMDLIPSVEGPLTTPHGLAILQGQAIDRNLWTDPGGYASLINQTAYCLNHLQSYGLCCCSQPGYISICPQDVQPTFHSSCS